MTHILDIQDPRKRKLVSGIAVAILAVLVLLGIKTGVESFQEMPAAGKYQAVFLTNGQVYFGKLSGLSGSYVTLKEVYLVQSAESPAAADQGNAPKPSPAPQSQLTLSRLDQNKLIHPEQEMIISKSSMLFWENMQDNAEVVKKIEELKAKRK
ncbi:MAG: hypothetical protein Q8Q11_01570 [bacterium]|nr:hypothetical protein [bacterium]MDZ4247839.1 hypothetical protein [Patescibacteria group bacterium]